GAREKYTARPPVSVTTLTRFGSLASAPSRSPAAVPIGSPRRTRATAPCSAAGATSGSSPCTFSTTSYELNDLLPTTSATRSVPDWWSAEVSTASYPARSTTAAISRASVATTRRSHTPASTTRRTTQRMRGSPARDRSGLRGRRLEIGRAHVTPRTGTGEHTRVVPRSLGHGAGNPQEVFQQAFTVLRPDRFRVKLHAVDGVPT